ncbi:MAG: DUF58 domain-containing protein [Vicinamibacterales bacterium]|jgi:uncharacterized protein (DUF58 family)|nr:DUF58 domain-containing protein [Vicinamibacterales bacterium]HIM51580.1 DUF58 domain-containing protein [Acidobacteriota bacterium]
MIPREILKQVRRVEIATRGLVNEVFSGEYHSVFKGRGMNFAEVRAYQYGDDIRSIDWNVTARTGTPFVKVFDEERELTVMLVVDVSASGDFGSRSRMKGEVAVEICAVLAFSAITNNDKVGLIIFSDRIEKFVPPRKGRRHGLRVLRELLYFQPEGRGTDVAGALGYLARVVRRRAVVFVVSDFFDTGYQKALAVAGRRHDTIVIRMGDPRERELPAVGYIELEDAETGEQLTVNVSDPAFREAFDHDVTETRTTLEREFRKTGIDVIEISTDRPYADRLMRFFRQRAKRFR